MRERTKTDEWIEGSDNIFRDFGCKNPEIAQLKSITALQIHKIIQERGLTQKEAASILGIAPTKVSNIVCGRLKSYSLDRLISYLLLLNVDVAFQFRHKTASNRPTKHFAKV